jgi:malate dehydrogenase (oxaloacetate-decarboxylating)(NADP+)
MLVQRSNYFASVMVECGEADGMVGGLKLAFPDTLRPALEILGLAPAVKVAAGMYMMVLQNSVKFFGDATINVNPDAETLADIAVQMSDAVAALGVAPRVAMISYSNFGSVRDPDVAKVHAALDLVRERRPELEIDGEMQPEIALDDARRKTRYPFSTLVRNANVLVFQNLAAGNAAYQTLKVLGGASAVGPLLLGVARPVALLQNEASVEDIVNMTAYTVTKAQQAEKRAEARRA